MGVVWAEFVTTSIILVVHIKEIWILKAWGTAMLKGPPGEHCIYSNNTPSVLETLGLRISLGIPC